MNKILRIFLNSDMRLGHQGLSVLARENGINVNELSPGNFIIYINTAKDRIKLYASNNIVAYYKTNHGKIDLRAIANIPRAFSASGRIEYDACLKQVLEKNLAK